MRNRRNRKSFLRVTHFESFEERLALSAHALGSIVADQGTEPPPLAHFGTMEAPAQPPLVQFGGDADFFLQDRMEQATPTDRGVQTLLGDVHELTGVNHVHNTYGFEGQTQTVAIIDSGIAYDHYALGAGFGEQYRVVGGYDFAENDADPYDDGPSGFHGTHVAGIVGSDNATYEGVASGVDLVALRVFDDDGAGYFSWVESALQWVHDHRNDFDNPITTVNLSLGAEWNSDSIPNWASLEDEFAQLEADGIFIAVAAGNSFQTFNAAGLSYPAVSPYVVPVASVDDNGLMSSFSQRHDRVLAAPGRSITSTVPDHTFTADGTPNDFGTASGTSMAAPYVAGASVLVREAMEFIGSQNITQDAIYDHFRDTADVFFDSATGANYHRINVQAAIDALMPSDDYGSTAGAAHSLGTLNDTVDFNGVIGTLSDADFFTFTAGLTGEVTMTADTTHNLAASWSLVGGPTGSGDSFSFEVVAGQNYTVSLSSSDGIGHYDISADLAEDLGTLEFSRMQDQDYRGDGEKWYMMTAGQSGLLTVEAFFAHGGGNMDLQLLDANQQVLDSSNTTTSNERLDATVAQGETYYLRLMGENADVDLRMVNMVSVSDGTVTVGGTASDDVIVFNAGSGYLSVNGLAYTPTMLSNATTLSVHGGGGSNAIHFWGSEADESVTARANGQIDLIGGSFNLHGSGFENMTLNGRGGADSLRLHDSATNDTLTGDPNQVSFVGDSFNIEASDFESVYAYALNGGDDQAQLIDSAGDDAFRSGPTAATFSGAGFYFELHLMEHVSVNSTQGGSDVARMYDSAADDVFEAGPTVAAILGDGFHNEVHHFDEVYAYAIHGGNDLAKLTDSAGDDRFRAGASGATLLGDGFLNHASGFDRVFAYSTTGGNDIAQLSDSAGDDLFRAGAKGATMLGDGFLNYAHHFESVYAYSTMGGQDMAQLHDSVGDDLFRAGAKGATMLGDGFLNYAHHFESVYAYSTMGGQDIARLYDSAGDDLFRAGAKGATMLGDGFLNYAHHFENVHAFATAGGNDVARLYDSAGDEVFRSGANGGTMIGVDFMNYAHHFEQIYAHASSGNDLAEFFDSSGDEVFHATALMASMTGSGFYNYGSGFDRVEAYASGGTDTARMYDSSGDDIFRARQNSVQLTGDGFDNSASGFERIRAVASTGSDIAIFDDLSPTYSLTDDNSDHVALNFSELQGFAQQESELLDQVFEEIGDDY